MAKLSFKTGAARIAIEADSEEKLAAYLGQLVFNSMTHGCKGIPAGVTITGTDPDRSWAWPVPLDTPERAQVLATLREVGLHDFIKSKHGGYCEVGYGRCEHLKHKQPKEPA
jgi:hypothetical protein